ncbi:hypothetical protein ACJW30_11G010000 [Castanea mollissima]
MNNLRDEVFGTELLFKAGNMSVGNGNGFRYGLVQCTRDINSTQCKNCPKILIEKVQDCCQARTEFRIISPSCNLRYANYSLIQEASTPVLVPLPSPLLPSPLPGNGNGRNITQIAIIVTTVIVLILVINLYIFLKGRKRKPKDYFQVLDSLQFVFGTIIIVTNNFSEANKLGKGCLVAKLQHRNLIRLLGFCLEGNEKLLIFEFVPNISIDHFIYDHTKRAQLASNVLLDAEMNSKISDFGMAKLFVPNQIEGSTNRIVGTHSIDYMVKSTNKKAIKELKVENFECYYYELYLKSNIFSLGVLILEIVSCRKVICLDHGENREHLLSYGTATNLTDHTLRDSPITEIMRPIHTGLLCVKTQAVARPNMTSVVAMINSDSITLPIPTRPSYFTQSDVVLDTPLQQDNGSHVTKLFNGQKIAVKWLSRNSRQGDPEFKNEVLLVANFQNTKIYLQKCAQLGWEKRYQIIRASNVLLDTEMNPKISDLGMAKLFVPDQTEGSTNRIVGTYRYMAPEYVMTGQFSVKLNVFILAWKNWMEGTATNLVDPTLRDSQITEIMRCIHTELLCIQKQLQLLP